jgi:crotonobetainyl-CoA:carnitine CoA-transferase CaiB-like acyl-CoA transferase
MAGPLAGLKVLDMSRIIAGPLCGQYLADLGADVIKLERPGEGDDSRRVAPPWLRDRDGNETRQSTMHLGVNRNKRSLALDFTTAEGAGLARRIAARSDVLIENFKVGALARYGLGWADLAPLNRGLVYCSVTGFGQDGPYAPRPGYDYVAQAMSGLMSVTGPAESPMRAGVPIVDMLAGMNAAIGVLAALEHRRRTGEGQRIDVSLLDSGVGALMNHATAWLNGGTLMPRTGNDHPSGVPYGVFPTTDRPIVIAVVNDREFARLAAALGRAEWAEDARFARNNERVANREALTAMIEATLRTKPAAEWLAAFDGASVPSGPLNGMAETFADPHLAARGAVVGLPHPIAGEARTAALPIRLSATPADYRRAAPLAGQHTDEILAELGLSAAEVERLKGAGTTR